MISFSVQINFIFGI
jgi:adenylate kinase family enzyme